MGDGKFMHFNITQKNDFADLNELQEFKDFQSELKTGGLVVPPKAMDLELIGSNMEII